MSLCDSIPAPSTPTRPTKKLRPDAPVRVLSESVVAVDDQHTARRLFYFEPEFTTPDRRPRAQVPNAPPRVFHTNSDNFYVCYASRMLSF